MNDRKQEIRAILERYTNRYTSAQFAESYAQVKRESKEIQDWFEQKRKELDMKDAEIAEILHELAEEAEKKDTAFFCDIEMSNN